MSVKRILLDASEGPLAEGNPNHFDPVVVRERGGHVFPVYRDKNGLRVQTNK